MKEPLTDSNSAQFNSHRIQFGGKKKKGAEGLAVYLVVADDEKELEKVLVRSKSGPHVNFSI